MCSWFPVFKRFLTPRTSFLGVPALENEVLGTGLLVADDLHGHAAFVFQLGQVVPLAVVKVIILNHFSPRNRFDEAIYRPPATEKSGRRDASKTDSATAWSPEPPF